MEELMLKGKRLEKIALVCNSQEITGQSYPQFLHEYKSQKTIQEILEALKKIAPNVCCLEADEGFYQRIIQLRAKNLVDLVFNLANGFQGESRESQIPAFLEFLGIPYTGGSILNTALILDKAKTKEVLSYHHLPVPASQVIYHPNEEIHNQLNYPLFLKPLHEGSSIGISNNSKVDNVQQLKKEALILFKKYQQPVLVEEYLPGREFSVGLLGNEILPLDEKVIKSVGFQSTEIKFGGRNKGCLEYICPVEDLSPKLSSKIYAISKKAFEVTYCQDLARADTRCDNQGHPYILDINSPASIAKDASSIDLEAKTAGYTYNDLIKKIVESAVNRYNKLMTYR